MEFVDGEPLDLYIQKYTLLPEFVAIPIFIQVLNGIGFAHQNKMIHRDIKPGNIVIGVDGLIKILDFGLAKVIQNKTGASESARAASLNYVAPERLKKKQIDIRTDIYSIGATMYETLTGRPPYIIEPGDWKDAELKHISGDFPSLNEFYSDHSVEVENVIRKALSPKVSQRYSNCESMKEDLITIWQKKVVPVNARPEFVTISEITNNIINGKLSKSLFHINNSSFPSAINRGQLEQDIRDNEEIERKIALESERIRRAEREKIEQRNREIVRRRQEEEKRAELRRLDEQKKREELKKLEEDRQRKIKIEGLIREATTQFNLLNYKKAREISTKVNKIEFGNKDANEILNKINEIESLKEKIENAKKEKVFVQLIDFYNAIYSINKNEVYALKEKNFCIKAKDYFTGYVYGKIARNIVTYDALINELNHLIDLSPDYCVKELKTIRKDLINNKKESDRKNEVEDINKKIKVTLTNDKYKKALELIKKVSPKIKNKNEEFYSEKNCNEVISIYKEIDEKFKKKDYSYTLKLFEKLNKLNPYSKIVKDQIDFYNLYFSSMSELQKVTGFVNVFKVAKKVKDKTKHLPEYLKTEIRDLILEKEVIIKDEKDRLIYKSEKYLKKNKFNNAIDSLIQIFEIEEDEKEVSKIRHSVNEIKRRKFVYYRNKTIKYTSIVTSVIFIIYLGTGPIPYYLNKKKVNRLIEASVLLIQNENFDDAKNKLEVIDETMEKLDDENELEKSIVGTFQKAYYTLIKKSKTFENKEDYDNAISRTRKALVFSFSLKSKTEKRISKLKYTKFFEIGEKYLKDENYSDAVGNFEIALKNVYTIKADNLLKESKYLKHFEIGNKKYKDKDYIKALKNFQLAKEQKSTSAVNKLISEVRKDAKIQRLNNDIEKYKKNKDYGNIYFTIVKLKKTKGEVIDRMSILENIAYTNNYGQKEIRIKGVKFVHISGGSFDMGCFDNDDKEIFTDAVPVHEVSLSGFWISKTEITVNQYKGNGINTPITLSWNAASSFVRMFGNSFGVKTDLPTEAQWEFAARGRGKKIKFPWGDTISKKNANYKSNSKGNVASYLENNGLFDISGNVREWCRDVYIEEYYSMSESTDPFNFLGGEERVVRGGSYADGANALKTYMRYSSGANSNDNLTGFRIVIYRQKINKKGGF